MNILWNAKTHTNVTMLNIRTLQIKMFPIYIFRIHVEKTIHNVSI